MLAFSLLRYWWLRPQVADPLQMENHDPLKSKSTTSFLEPPTGPQLPGEPQKWSKVPHYYGGTNPKQRSMLEIEKAIAEGKDMILVEPEISGQIYFHYVSHGWLLQENTILYGISAIWFSYFHPKLWFVYTPCSFIALMHSWVYFRVYKYDRLSQYQAYDDDRHPVSNLITAWVFGQRPDHYQYVLRKERIIRWEILSETIMYTSIILTLYRLMQIEDSVVGDRFTSAFGTPKTVLEALSEPAYESGYFQPNELISVAPGSFLPFHIPYVKGWFDLPWFKFRVKPMKLDLAIIIALMGSYFIYKGLLHFWGSSEEADELGREWSTSMAGEQKSCCSKKDVNPYWLEIKDDNDDLNLSKQPGNQKTIEQNEVTRIASRTPYGWVPPGYSENHYGVFV